MRFLILFVLSAVSCSALVQPFPLVGFCWVSPPLSDSTLFDEGFSVAHHLGCQIEHRQYNWNQIEKEKNEYDWSMVDQWYNACSKNDIVPSLAVCPLNSNSVYRTFPKDLAGRSFDDPEVILRLQQFISVFMERYPEVRYLSFGNEINYYLKGHWHEVRSYLDMCLRMYQYMKENYPHVNVLVIFGFTGMEKREEEMILLFLPACDIVGISSYHASIALESLAPPRLTEEEMREALEYCINLCGEKRFAIVETAAFSYPDPDYQAQYVHVFFDIIREHREDMEFACWFLTYDWCPGMLTTVDPFLEQFSSAGLLEPDGTPKPSYYAWMEEMSQLGIVSTPVSSRFLAAGLTVVIILWLLKRGTE